MRFHCGFWVAILLAWVSWNALRRSFNVTVMVTVLPEALAGSWRARNTTTRCSGSGQMGWLGREKIG